MNRYIDADELFKRINKLGLQTDNAINDYYYQYGVTDALDEVEDMPTANVQEVRYGRWILNEFGGWRCSACNEIAIVNGNENYCPWCGASMVDEEEQE